MVLVDEGWGTDPQGIACEYFHTLSNIPLFSETSKTPAQLADRQQGTCCAPKSIPAARPERCCTRDSEAHRFGIPPAKAKMYELSPLTRETSGVVNASLEDVGIVLFERYLTVWVGLCTIAGTFAAFARISLGQVNAKTVRRGSP